MTAKGRNIRVATQCQVLIDHRGRRISAHSEDVSATGVFVRTRTPFRIGDAVEIHLTVPSHRPFSLRAQVVHSLEVAQARALGRAPGVGFVFIEGDLQALRAHLAKLEKTHAAAKPDTPEPFSAVVVDAHEPLLARIRNALSDGLAARIDTFSDTAEAMVAVLEEPPNVIIASAEMTGMSGIDFLQRVREHGRLAKLPFLIITSGGDLARLEALRSGASDVVSRPFTDEEMELRLRRLLSDGRTSDEAPPEAGLHGSLATIGLGTVLSLLEFERKSGHLAIVHETERVAVHVSDGRVVAVEGLTTALSAEDRLMVVLEWHSGRFEFHSGEPTADEGISLSIQHLLLEHARVVDEG